MTRAQQAEIATKLQIALNDGEYNGSYSIRYDMGDSGMTWCFYKNKFYKRVKNDAMFAHLNIGEYVAPIELRDPIFGIA